MERNFFFSQARQYRTLSIFGAGGSGREVAWLAEQVGWSADGLRFLVDIAEAAGRPVNGIPVQMLGEMTPSAEDAYVVGIGKPKDRERCSALCEQLGYVATTLVHPRIEASRHIEAGPGTIICAGNVITTNVILGKHVHVNLDCTISHDVRIGDFATLSPGVHVSGNVWIGERAFIGTGAVIIDGTAQKPLVIGNDAVVAAGACVTKSVEPFAMVAGVPAQRKR